MLRGCFNKGTYRGTTPHWLEISFGKYCAKTSYCCKPHNREGRHQQHWPPFRTHKKNKVPRRPAALLTRGYHGMNFSKCTVSATRSTTNRDACISLMHLAGRPSSALVVFVGASPPLRSGDGCSCRFSHSASRHIHSKSNSAIADAFASSAKFNPGINQPWGRIDAARVKQGAR